MATKERLAREKKIDKEIKDIKDRLDVLEKGAKKAK